MRIHRCGPPDGPTIGAMELACFPDSPWSIEQVGGELRRAGGFVLLEPELGYAIGWSLVGEAELLRIGVLPHRRGEGGGGRLLRAVEEAARELGAERIFLEVRDGNTAAIGLYEGAGWRCYARRRRYYADGADALLFDRPLSSP